MNFFKKILSGVEWFGKEIGKGFAALPKLIKLSKDAEAIGVNVVPETVVVIQDAGKLSTAIVKDSGVFIAGFSALVGAISIAIAAKALNVSADEGVVVAFEAFVKDFNATNVQDVIAALDQLVADTRTLDATVLAGLRKLEADAKS